MSTKHWLLGPTYLRVHRLLECRGSLDPREAKDVVFRALYSDRPGVLRSLAAAVYYWRTRLKYRGHRARAIAAHYDLPPAFYRLFTDFWYGAYSCGLFDDASMTLEAAQQRKFRRLVEKLDVKHGQRILEVGCGWGSFLKYASEVGLDAEGIALSQEQVMECRRRGFKANYADAANGLPGPVDRVITIGMMEHAKNQRGRILQNCFRALPSGARMVVEEMSSSSESAHLPAIAFAAEEYLPGDRLASYTSIMQASRRAGFRVAHVECLGWHYRTTILEWSRRLAERFEEAEALVGYRTAMMHLLCQLGFAWHFEVGAIDLVHYVLVKPDSGA
jgi:cyclopropane-fatty-acyl-phospholipid synthase